MKTHELVSLTYNDGWYKVCMFNSDTGCYEFKNFLWYSKKSIARILRNEYNCKCSNKIIYGSV